MVSIRAALCLGLGLIAQSPAASTPLAVSPAEMANYEKGFSAVQQDAKSYRADFRQILYLEGLNKPIISVGVLYFQSPDRLAIRFSQPAGEWTIVNGAKMALQKQGQPLKVQDLSAEGPRKSPSHMASLLDFFHSGAARWHKDFDVGMIRNGDILYVKLTPYLTPTAPAQGVDEILTTLRLPGYDLTDMQINFNSANRFEYQFTNGRRNVPLDSALFQIPTPK